MRTTAQDYRDADFATAKAAGCDTLQLKYDGWWVYLHLLDGRARVYSKSGRFLHDFPVLTDKNIMLVGEYMWGTQWAQDPFRKGQFFLFDCWHYDGHRMHEVPYIDRFRLLKSIQASGVLSAKCELVKNYSIDSYNTVWNNEVVTGKYEGVVFRKKADLIDVTLLRQKATVTEDLCCEGFVEGEGKHAGRLGALVGRSRAGTIVQVGGGFTDADREHIWHNRPEFIHRWFEAEARAKFESGSLRHPNFLRWREDLT